MRSRGLGEMMEVTTLCVFENKVTSYTKVVRDQLFIICEELFQNIFELFFQYKRLTFFSLKVFSHPLLIVP